MWEKKLLIFHAEKIKFQNIPKDFFTWETFVQIVFSWEKNSFWKFWKIWKLYLIFKAAKAKILPQNCIQQEMVLKMFLLSYFEYHQILSEYSYGWYKALEQNHKVAKRKEKHCAELLTRGTLLESKASSLQPTNT